MMLTIASYLVFVGRLLLRKEKTETENKYEIFQKAYANANALL